MTKTQKFGPTDNQQGMLGLAVIGESAMGEGTMLEQPEGAAPVRGRAVGSASDESGGMLPVEMGDPGPYPPIIEACCCSYQLMADGSRERHVPITGCRAAHWNPATGRAVVDRRDCLPVKAVKGAS